MCQERSTSNRSTLMERSLGWKPREKCAPLSCVLLLSDGPGTVLGRMLSNFWEAFDDDNQAISDFLIAEIEESKKKQSPAVLRRAGHVMLFPLGFFFPLQCW